MKTLIFIFLVYSGVICFADDFTANSACIKIAERLDFIPKNITVSALKSGEVLTIFGGKDQTISISRGIESKSHPGSYPLIALDGGSCTSTNVNSMTPGGYISSGLAQYIGSERVKKKDLNEVISVCQNAPAFKEEIKRTLKLNRKATDSIVGKAQ